MRIMEMISGTAVNGAVVNCVELTRALHARGHEVTIVCRPDSWVIPQLRNTSIPIITSSLKRWPPDELKRIAAEIRARDIDVLHTHMSSANFFGVLLRRVFGIPCCVATAHNRYFQLHWMWNDRVLAVSEATKQFHNRYNFVPRRRIDVVHNFIDDQRFRRVPRSLGPRLRDEMGIPKNCQLMGIIGDVIPRKGLLYLVRALPEVLAKTPDAHLVCVGHQRPEYTEQVRAEAERLSVASHITWTGARNDIHRVMAMLDVYVLPSLEENMPLAILEAMASGLPVVASAVGGIPECVTEGETGFLVSPADASGLATALTNVLTNSHVAARLGSNGRQRVRNNFSIDSQVSQIESIFSRLAQKRPGIRQAG